MGERELREKYGGKLAKAINRAIRAEIPGGPEALDALPNLAAAAKESRWADRAGKDTPEAVAYYKHLHDVVGRMDAQVRKKWGIPLNPTARDPKPKGPVARTARAKNPKASRPKARSPKARGKPQG